MKYTFWLTVAAICQLLSSLIHSMSFFVDPVPANDTEKTMLDLMNNYKMNMGAGYSRSMTDLLTGLSACFTMLYLFGALLNWYLLRKKVDLNLLRGIVIIQTGIFGISFIIMARFTFLPPIVLTGLCFLFLLLTLVRMPKES